MQLYKQPVMVSALLSDQLTNYSQVEYTVLHGSSVAADVQENTSVVVNLNTTVPPTEDNVFSLFIDIVGIWATGVCCLVGLIGNILSICVLARAHARSPMFYVLRAVAASDAIFLLSAFITLTLVNLYDKIGGIVWFKNNRGYIQFAVWPILMMSQMSTVWLTVLVSAERYIAVCRPLKAASICTIPKVRRAVVIVFVISILYNIPRYFEYKVVEHGMHMSKSDIGQDEVYRYLYTCVLYSVLLFLLPLVLLVFLNMKLIIALKQGKKEWKKLHFKQKKEQNLTIIPLTIVLIFFFCGTPSLSVNVIDSINVKIIESKSFLVYMLVANLLVVINSACNFIIYCLLGKKFRNKLLDLLRCHCTKYRSVYSMNYSMSE